jgi:cytochrome c556
MIRKIALTGAAALSMAAFISVSAQQNDEPTPEERAIAAAETRQAVFKLLRYNMDAINGMARGEVEFDPELAERNARRVADLAPMIPELFAANDTRAFDVRTAAEPHIWDRFDEFSNLAGELEAAATEFASVAATGDRAQLLGGIRAFGATCGNCHRPFRE